ncbi:MAG: type II secretion system minor pseudopilin GspK [Pseudomonadota bacterium]
MRSRVRQRGAALLLAMLTVTLVATFAATAMWQQWRNAEVEGTERARVQAGWVLIGALDWSRLILREDGIANGRMGSGPVDSLAEPWAVPLQEARLSTFLAADRNNTVSDPADTQDAFLSGQIVDAQSRLNVTDLVDNGQVSPVWLAAFQRLFTQLGLPVQEVPRIAQGLLAAQGDGDGAALQPQRLEQLAWFGVDPQVLQALQPYVTVLPERSAVNLNTASAPVLVAAVQGLDMASAQRAVAARTAAPFRSFDDARRVMGAAAVLDSGLHSVWTQFFEVRGRLRLENAVVEERSLVKRQGIDVVTLWRERGAPGMAQVPSLQSAGMGTGR